MPFDLNKFRNALTHGGARPSQFEMRVFWPTSWRPEAGTTEDLRFLCQTSQIPGSTINTIPVPYFGRKLNYAGDRTFDSLSVTILNDENFKIRRALEAWMKAIQDHSTSLSYFNGGITASSYVADSHVIHYSRNNVVGAPIAAYKFVGMFPSGVEPITLDWNSTDTIETFGATFHYQWWEPIAVTDIGL